jgi:uncharacterized protein (DUF1499 family)
MSKDANIAKQIVHDKLESQIKTAVKKLETLKLKAEAAKAILEIKAIVALVPKAQAIQQKLQELKTSGGERWEQVKADVEARIAEFEKSLEALESEPKSKAS